MAVTYCPSCYSDELLEEYPFLSYVDIYTVDYYDLPYGVLGATNGKDIILVRRDLPTYLFKHTLFHECEHIKDPYASEFEVEMEAREKSGLPSYII